MSALGPAIACPPGSSNGPPTRTGPRRISAACLKAIASGLVNGASSFLAKVLVVGFYLSFLLIEDRHFPMRVEAGFAPEQAGRMLGIAGSINRAIASYLRAKVLSSLVTVLPVMAILWAFGVPFPGMCGALAFVGNFIPFVGSLVAFVLPVLLAFLELEPISRPLAVLVLLVLVQVVTGLPHGWRAPGKSVGSNPGVHTMAKTRRTFTPEFKAEAVKLVTEQGRSFVEAAHDLDIGESTLRSWRQAIVTGGAQAFPGRGQPARPRGGTAPPPGRGQAADDGARHPEKSDGLLRQGVVMRYDFVEAHRGRWPVRLMCRVLRVSPGGYYDWRGRPASAQDAATRGPGRRDQGRPRRGEGPLRQPADPRRAGRPGQPCCVNTVARLMRRARDRRQDEAEVPLHDRLEPRPPGGRERLDRQFEPAAADRVWAADITYIATRRGLAVPGGRRGPLLAADRRLVDGPSGSTAGWSSMPWRWPSPASSARRGAGGALGPGQPVRQRALPAAPGRPWDRLQHEPAGELLG